MNINDLEKLLEPIQEPNKNYIPEIQKCPKRDRIEPYILAAIEDNKNGKKNILESLHWIFCNIEEFDYWASFEICYGYFYVSYVDISMYAAKYYL